MIAIYRGIVKKWGLPILFLGFITIFWALKTLYFVHELDVSPHKKFILLASGGLGLWITAIFFINKSKVSAVVSLLIYTLFSFLLYADVVYERYYDAILNIDLLGQADQVGDIFDSIISLLYISDVFYWLDIPVLIVLSVLVFKRIPKQTNLIGSFSLFVLGTVCILITAFVPLKTSYSDQYKVALTGVIPSHIFDTTQTILDQKRVVEVSAQNQEMMIKLQERFLRNQEVQKNSTSFGKYNGKNVIIVQAESLNNFPINLKVSGKEITPNLNKLVEKSYYYPNTYLQIGRGNTSDAEFVANNSIYPIASKGIYKTFPTNDYLSLGSVLRKEGYSTSATHGNTPEFWNRQNAYENQGYEQFYHMNHPKINADEILGLGISDESIFNQMLEIYQEEEKPFYSFIVSLSVHRPFELPKEYQLLDLPGQFNNSNTGNYLQSVHYFDRALGMFIDGLKQANLWDETIFVVYGDHYGLLPNDTEGIERLLDITFDEKTRFQIPLIMHYPGQEEGVVNEVVASQMDIAPTITTLIGIQQPLIQFGVPLEEKKEGFAGFAYETTKYSYYSNKFDYIASHDGVYERGTCINNETNEQIDVEVCRAGYEKLYEDIEISKFLLENNQIGRVFKDLIPQ